MAELIWTERATTDLEDIYDFIAKDSLCEISSGENC
jgi:plasmid stabilization system protein ParE